MVTLRLNQILFQSFWRVQRTFFQKGSLVVPRSLRSPVPRTLLAGAVQHRAGGVDGEAVVGADMGEEVIGEVAIEVNELAAGGTTEVDVRVAIVACHVAIDRRGGTAVAACPILAVATDGSIRHQLGKLAIEGAFAATGGGIGVQPGGQLIHGIWGIGVRRQKRDQALSARGFVRTCHILPPFLGLRPLRPPSKSHSV